MKQSSHPQSPLLVSRSHHLHSKLPNELKKPSNVSHAEGKKKQSVCRCIPSDEIWQKVSIRKNASEQNNATKVLSAIFFFNEPAITGQRNLSQSSNLVSFFPECMSPPVIEFTKKIQNSSTAGGQKWRAAVLSRTHRRKLTARCTICAAMTA